MFSIKMVRWTWRISVLCGAYREKSKSLMRLSNQQTLRWPNYMHGPTPFTVLVFTRSIEDCWLSSDATAIGRVYVKLCCIHRETDGPYNNIKLNDLKCFTDGVFSILCGDSIHQKSCGDSGYHNLTFLCCNPHIPGRRSMHKDIEGTSVCQSTPTTLWNFLKTLLNWFRLGSGNRRQCTSLNIQSHRYDSSWSLKATMSVNKHLITGNVIRLITVHQLITPGVNHTTHRHGNAKIKGHSTQNIMMPPIKDK